MVITITDPVTSHPREAPAHVDKSRYNVVVFATLEVQGVRNSFSSAKCWVFECDSTKDFVIACFRVTLNVFLHVDSDTRSSWEAGWHKCFKHDTTRNLNSGLNSSCTFKCLCISYSNSVVADSQYVPLYFILSSLHLERVGISIVIVSISNPLISTTSTPSHVHCGLNVVTKIASCFPEVHGVTNSFVCGQSWVLYVYLTKEWALAWSRYALDVFLDVDIEA